MFKILNLEDRDYFYQWDLNQKLIVEDTTITEVHFSNKTDDCALIVEVKEEDGRRVAAVPNILLTDYWTIRAYGYCGECFTRQEAAFKVVKRSKPSDYIYTETEVKNYEEFEARLKALEEKEVDLTGYVKNTDFASDAIGGVIKTDSRYGTRMVNGVLDICAANNTLIDSRTPNANSLYSAGINTRHTIVPSNIDYAVKSVLSNPKVELTEEEKEAAQEWLGLGSIETALDNIIAIQEALKPALPIQFTIDTWGTINNCTALEGMTWGEWCASEYNTVEAYVADGSLYIGLSGVCDEAGYVFQYPNDAIIANHHYIVW